MKGGDDVHNVAYAFHSDFCQRYFLYVLLEFCCVRLGQVVLPAYNFPVELEDVCAAMWWMMEYDSTDLTNLTAILEQLDDRTSNSLTQLCRCGEQFSKFVSSMVYR